MSAQEQWSAQSALPDPVQEIYPTVSGDQIILAGGIVNVRPLAPHATDRTLFWTPSGGTNVWRTGPRLPEPRHHPCLLPLADRILAIGGFFGRYLDTRDFWQMKATVFVLDATRLGWRPGPNLPGPRAEFAAGVLDGHVVVAGGRAPGVANQEYEDHADVVSTLVLDPSGSSWREAAPIPVPRNSAAAVVLGGKLHVIGGRRMAGLENTSAHEAYDLRTDSWERRRDLPRARAGLAAAVWQDKWIYVFGGENLSTDEAFGDVWRYDQDTDSWEEMDPMPEPRHGHGAIPLSDGIHLIGGSTTANVQGTCNYHHVLWPS